MPVICTKEKDKCYEVITGRVLDKKRADIKISNQTLKTFSVKSSDTPTNSKFLIGSSIPNSTVKRTINRNDTSDSTIIKGQELHVSESVINKTEFPKNDSVELINQEEKSKDDIKRSSNPSSIVAGSEKLQELQELQKQLQKSYEPKPLFTPRRPTLESIKSAIEKAKQENERNKKVGTEEYKSAVTVSDVSTSTEKITKKKHKKKKTPNKQASSSNSSTITNEVKTKNSKKITVNVKLNKKIDKSADKTD